MKRLPLALLLLTAPLPGWSDDCTRETAQEELTALYEEVAERAGQAQAPSLQKEKIGHVLVARAAPPDPLADPAMRKKLIDDINRAAGMLGAKPTRVCAEVEKIRGKYGFN